MKYRTIVIAALVPLVAFGTARTARAQSSTAQAETLFRQGKDLIAQGKLAEACAAFDASQKLDPTTATLLNQASCREKNGQLATAWGLFLDAERQTRGASDDAGRRFNKVAADHAAKLEPRLSTLTITVPAENRVGGLEILRDQEPIDPGAWNKALPVDGGTYKITARAPGNAEWSSSITIGVEHDAKSLEIPKLKAAELAPATGSDKPGPASTAQTAPAHSRVLPLVLGGAALGLGGGALGFELWARSTYDKSEGEPNDPRQESLWKSSNTRRHIAQGLGIAAAASAGVAIWLYLRSGNETEPAAPQTSRLLLQPVLGSDQAGLVLLGSY